VRGTTRLWVAALVAASISVMPSAAVNGADAVDDNQVPILNMAGEGDLHIFADEAFQMTSAEAPSMLALGTADNTSFCSDADSGVCAGKPNLWFYAHLPVCDSAEKIDCIVSLSATSGSGSESSASFSRYFPDKAPTSFPGKPSVKFPTGRSPGTWSIPGAPHPGGTDYALSVRLDGGTENRAGATMQMVLTAVSLKTDADTSSNYEMPKWIQPGRQAGPASDRGRFRCAYWGENGSCLLSRSFPAETRFTVKVRLAVEPSGWLHGRLSQPDITFSRNTDSVDVSVTAAPVQVPAFRVARKHLEFPEAVQRDFGPGGKFGFGGSRSPGGAELTDLTKRNAEYNVVSYREQSFDQLDAVTGLISDTASYAPWVWSVRTLSGEEMRTAGKCLTTGDGVKGIVTTNATIYGSGPPALSSDGTTLDYRIAAPHLTRTGTEFKGEYNLAVRSDVADCLYGLSDESSTSGSGYVEESAYTDDTWVDDGGANIDAAEGDFVDEEPAFEDEVSADELLTDETAIVIENPTDVVASTRASFTGQLATGPNTTVRESDGWVFFSATGLTFSSPQMKVQLAETPVKVVLCSRGSSFFRVTVRAQKCPAGSSPVRVQHCTRRGLVKVAVGSAPKCPRGYSKATAITCIQGSTARKAIASSPKCPRGFAKAVTIHCVKGKAARVVTAARPACANGFAKARIIACRKGKAVRSVLAVAPRCPKGFRTA